MPTLLAIDVGNTHTVAGLFLGDDLKDHWRVATQTHSTADQLAASYSTLMTLKGFQLGQVDRVVLSSVVPTLVRQYEQMATQYLGTEALVVGPGVRTGLPILTNNPHEVGADRIVNAVAALEELGGGPCVVVDFGTATTFCAISSEGEYLGGAIAPGVEVSLEALTARAARLSRVELSAPAGVIGKTTAESLRAGVIMGFAGLVDGIVTRMQAELGAAANERTLATGGLARLMAPHTRTLNRVDTLLTLKGLKLVFKRNEKN